MKILNQVKILLSFFAVILLITSCSDDDIVTKAETDLFTIGGSIVSASGVTNEGEYDLCCIDDAVVEYTVQTAGAAAGSVERTITHAPSGLTGSLSAITSFPATASVSITEAAAAVGASTDVLEVGDSFTITHTVDGKPSGAVVTIGVVNSVVVFRSALGGVFDATATNTNQGAGIGWDDCDGNTWSGTVEWVAEHTLPDDTGVYLAYSVDGTGASNEDISMGGYYPCYNSDAASLPLGDLRITDVDGKIAITGASQWGEVYTVTQAVGDGPTATIGWTNDYGEGAIIELTRTDGTDWPTLSN